MPSVDAGCQMCDGKRGITTLVAYLDDSPSYHLRHNDVESGRSQMRYLNGDTLLYRMVG